MHVETRSLALALLVIAPAAALAGEPPRIPRPLAPFVDKPASADASTAIPPTPVRPVRAWNRAKALPPDAPGRADTPLTLTGVLLDEPGDGRVWARGRDYKASFDREGLTFVPFLGSDAPRNHPVSFRLASVSVDGAPVALDGDGSLSRVQRRVAIERGAADEVYDLAEGAIEQTIVVESLPARGDLVVTIDVTTDLAAHVEDGVVHFANERGGVDYGRVTVLDRDERAYTTSATLVDGDLRIEVPASFVESAALPLRVDPLITTSIVGPGMVDEIPSDVSYDASTGNWVVVHEYAYSSVDHDVFAQTLDSSGSASQSLTAIVDVTTDSWSLPSVADNSLAQQFLAVAGVVPPGSGTSTIRGRTLEAATLLTSAQFTISGGESGSKVHPVVGGDPANVGPTYYCVVWQRDFAGNDSDIHARLVDPSATPLGTGPILVDNSGATIDLTPSISKCDGGPPSATQEWNVVWRRFVPSAQSSDVYAAQIHWDGGITTASTAIDTSSGNDVNPYASSPLDVPSGPRPWLAAFTRQTPGDGDLVGVSMLGGSNFGNVYLTSLDGTNILEDQLLTGIDCDGQQVVVGFAESVQGSATDYDTYVSSFAILDNQYVATESHVLLDYSGFASFAARVAAATSSGGPARTFGLSWSTLFPTPTPAGVTFGLYSTPTEGPAGPYCHSGDGVTTCPCGNLGASGNGCASSADPNGANLDATGSHALSTDSFVLAASGLPPTATCLFFQGTTQVALPFGDGARCVGGTTTRLGIETASSGVASYPTGADIPVSLKGLLPVEGGRRFYQVWYRDSAPFCTASSFNLTNGYEAIWLP